MGSTRNAFVALLINCGDLWIIPNLQLHRRFVSNNHIFQRYPWLTSDIIASVNTFSHKFKTNFMSSSFQTTTIFLISDIILIFYKFLSSNKEKQPLLCRSYNQILLAVTILQGQYLSVKVDGSHSLIDITPLSAQISASKFHNLEALIPQKKCGVWKNSVVFGSNTTQIPPLAEWCLH